MKVRQIAIHNFRSVTDATLRVGNYGLLVGPNNAGKSNILNAVRAFYDDLKWTASDVPRIEGIDDESWVEIGYELTLDEWEGLAEKYKAGVEGPFLRVRRYFRSNKDRVKSNQSNLYGYSNGALEGDLFYGAKNVGSAKLGKVIYIPALTTPDEQTKLSGPSPLRNILNLVLKKIVRNSPSYAALEGAFQNLNEEARGDDGFLNEVAKPLNQAIENWRIKFDLSINSVKPEDISKNLISFAFLDVALGDAAFELSRYGHGFQRTVIYELLRLAPTIEEVRQPGKKEFDPDFTLILFEEPETFLHPSQQAHMAQDLQKLAEQPGQQALISTHSSFFAGKASDDIRQLIRCRRQEGVTKIVQADSDALAQIFAQGGEFLRALNAFVADRNVPEASKRRARKLIANPPIDDIAIAEERFRFQLWLDSERASLFFADTVLLVEGPSEKALFGYLLSTSWSDLRHHKICIVDVLGKFNFHRFMALLAAFEIPYGIILDDDNAHDHHQAINDLVDRLAVRPIVAPPEKIVDCIETFLGLPKQNARPDRKPLEVIKAITGATIEANRLAGLKEAFQRALALA